MSEERENASESFALANGVAALLNNEEELADFRKSPEQAIKIAAKWGVKLDRDRAVFLGSFFGRVSSHRKGVTEAIALAVGGPVEAFPNKGPSGGGDGPSICFCLTLSFAECVAARLALTGHGIRVRPNGDPESIRDD